MNEQPLISVIMPIYNGEKFIADAIEIIKTQTYSNTEIIIVNDGSTDRTQEIIDGLKDDTIRTVFQENQGPSGARNSGLKEARGDIIAFLDVDDQWPKNKLEMQIKYLMEDSSLDFVVGKVQYIRDNKNILFPFISVNVGSCLFRRSAFDKTGLFDKDFYCSEDLDWIMRAREKGLKFKTIKETALFYVRHTTNITREKTLQELDLFRALKKSLDRRRKENRGEVRALSNFFKLELVSVVLPVYNGGKYLEETIRSVLDQEFRNFEFIVVDDGSTDNSAEIIKKYNEIKYIYQDNQGVASARNRGVEESRGEFIAFIDQDDLWTPEKLSVQVRYLLRHPEVSCVISKQEIFLEPGTEKPGWLKDEILKETQPGFLLGTVMGYRHLFENENRFDTSYQYSSDTDWFFRMKNAGVRMKLLDAVLLRKRIHHNNQSYDVKKIQHEVLKVVKTSIKRQKRSCIDDK